MRQVVLATLKRHPLPPIPEARRRRKLIMRNSKAGPTNDALRARPPCGYLRAIGLQCSRPGLKQDASSKRCSCPRCGQGAPMSDRSLFVSPPSRPFRSILAATLVFLAAMPAAAGPLCRPALTVDEVKFSDVRLSQRVWSARAGKHGCARA